MAAPDMIVPVKPRYSSFLVGLVLGLVVGYGAGAVTGNGCPPVPVPGAQDGQGGEQSQHDEAKP